ncbi:phage protein [Pseudoalteromonas undina]|uniref:phage protein n=1 Tax=Pseudoalteromonas undina TaxID=43660 RepID=UPI001867D2A5|nr:phage protein [Pseudoalteromonas undina]
MRLSGMNFNVNLGDIMVQVDTASLAITDNSAPSQTGGVPDGWVDGDVSASGELSVNASNFTLISDAAKTAGAWRGMETFDIMFYAKTSKDEMKIEAFGCRIKLSDILDIDKKGGSASLFKIPFDVTSPDFVNINGVPYLRPDEIENIVQ